LKISRSKSIGDFSSVSTFPPNQNYPFLLGQSYIITTSSSFTMDGPSSGTANKEKCYYGIDVSHSPELKSCFPP
jgi:hypothetical protein